MQFSSKKILCAALILCGLLFAAALILMWSAPRTVPVLNYHQVEVKDGNPLTLHPEQFEAQMAYLKEEGYTTVTIDELMDACENGAALPEKPVVITFDDGYVSRLPDME